MFVYVLHLISSIKHRLSILQLGAIRCVRLDAPAVGRYKQAVYHRSSEAVWTERKCRACTILLDFQVYLLVLHHKTQEEHACILHVLKYIIYHGWHTLQPIEYWLPWGCQRQQVPALLLIKWVRVQGACWITMQTVLLPHSWSVLSKPIAHH